MDNKVMEIISQIDILEGNNIRSKSTGNIYSKDDFIERISKALKLSKTQKSELQAYFIEYIRPQSAKSKYIEDIMNKYNLMFNDGIYFVNNNICTLEDLYKILWREERLLPTEVDEIVENIEKISETDDLQYLIYDTIFKKRKQGKSKYLASLYELYPNIKWRELLHNILVPKTKPMFHIFYDDGVGGTGKSTLLEVLTKIVGEGYVSNVLLDQFGNRFIFANMLGKYLNIGDDNGKNDELQNVGTLKSIVTGNRVTIDRKNISPIEVRIFAKQLFATNILPYIDFTDGGIMRRLNIVKMNKVIPPTMEMCKIDEDEIGHILNEIFYTEDLEQNENDLAITNSPLYRYYKEAKTPTYQGYRDFCVSNGFRTMNIINYEVKSKFIVNYKQTHMEEVKKDELPF